MQMKKTVLFLISVLFFGALLAQESPHTDTLGVKVYFRQGYSLLEPSYRDNGVRLLLLPRMSNLCSGTRWSE